MAFNRRLMIAGMALAAGLAPVGCGPRRPAPMSAFEGKLSDWTREILADSPELASQAGVTPEVAGGPYGDRLDDRSAIALEARRSAAIRRYAELRGLPPAGLNNAERLTLAVLESQFANSSAGAEFDYGEFSALGSLKPYVLNQLDSAFINLPAFLDERHPIASNADAEAYLRRLSAAALAIDQETERARADAARGIRPPLFIIDGTLALLDGVIATPSLAQPYVTGFRHKLEALAARAADPTRRAALEQRHLGYLARAEQIVRDHVIPAHQRAAQFLRSERARADDNPAVTRLPRGVEFYTTALRIETTTSLSPNEIHEIGLRRIAELNRDLDIALRRVGLTEGAAGQRLAQLTADPRYLYPETEEGRAQLLADVQTRVNGVLARADQWFGRLPRAKLEVRRVPAFAEAGQPGASYSAPSIEGGQPGIYYVNLRNLREMTRIDLPTQDFHEAVPGHHFQTALALELDDTPLIRRLITVNAYSEGWGLYAEQLADELNFYANDPIGRIGYLRWQLWRAARLVVDTGLHAKGWSRQQAIDYLIAATGDSWSTVATEVDRYVVWPGQACGYELGRREIVALRERARRALGPDFDLRGFHDVVLLNGEVPLPVLEQLVDEWIPRRQREAQRQGS